METRLFIKLKLKFSTFQCKFSAFIFLIKYNILIKFRSEVFNLSLDLTCIGSTGPVIVYTQSQYNSEVIPTWISVDYPNFLMSGTAPTATVNSTHNFYIDADSTSWNFTARKLITVNLVCETT